MTVTLLVTAAGGGDVSIYEGNPADESPHTSPLTNLSRLKFHSDLAYPKIIAEQTVNVTFPARTVVSGGINTAPAHTTTQSTTLFAHGRPGFPWVLASVTIAGNKVPFCGSVPVQMATYYGDGTTERPWARWVSVGADATHVTAFEYTVVDRLSATGFSECRLPAITLPITVWVTDEILQS